MNLFRSRGVLVIAALLAIGPATLAQQKTSGLHIGYVYPAGGRQGTCQRHLYPSIRRRSSRAELPEKLRAKEAGMR